MGYNVEPIVQLQCQTNQCDQIHKLQMFPTVETIYIVSQIAWLDLYYTVQSTQVMYINTIPISCQYLVLVQETG
jgi:hypothetical protein